MPRPSDRGRRKRCSSAGRASSSPSHQRDRARAPEQPARREARRLGFEITADLDEEAREIVLTIHWKGGQHSQLRLRKPRSGEHDCSTPDDALAVIRSMATRWSDEDIAATLNRMRLPTGQGKTWTAHRVGSIRRFRGIHAYRSAEKDGTWLTT